MSSSTLHSEVDVQIEATTRLIRAGTEFDATREVLHRWFVDEHGIAFTESHKGQWVWIYTSGIRPKGEHLFNSFHELIEHLLEQVSGEFANH